MGFEPMLPAWKAGVLDQTIRIMHNTTELAAADSPQKRDVQGVGGTYTYSYALRCQIY